MPPCDITKTQKPAIKKKKATSRKAAALATMSAPSLSSDAVYFWRPQDNNGFMSQWYSSPFEHDGIKYATAEMWMMVQKAKLFKDESIAAEMAATDDPKVHKALGRKVSNYDQKIWNDNKLRIVEEGSWCKFTASENVDELKPQLLATAEKEIVEASPLDKIWGIGFKEENAEKNRAHWGQNLLGIALMNVRKRIRHEEGESKEEN